jgi:hypothetical protein
MADKDVKKKESDPAKAEAAAATPAKGGMKKTAIILVAVLALEGGTVAVTMWLSQPKQAEAKALHADDPMELEKKKIVETALATGKFPNMKTGRNILYDMEIFITSRKGDEAHVKQVMDSSKAQIGMEVATIIRKAEPEWFGEPTLATLRRQIKAAMDERFGKDVEEKPIVQEVVITKCTPYRADF